MKKIKIGQIGIGHNHGEPKMLAVRKFTELFEVTGYAEENDRWIEKRGNNKGYEGLPRLSVEEIIKKSDAVLIESDVWNVTKYARRCIEAAGTFIWINPQAVRLRNINMYSIWQRKKISFFSSVICTATIPRC